jgi:hypothetical protein
MTSGADLKVVFCTEYLVVNSVRQQSLKSQRSLDRKHAILALVRLLARLAALEQSRDSATEQTK